MPYLRRADLKALELCRRRSQASGNLVLLSFKILFEAAQIHKEKANLQDDERIRLCVDSPNNPEHITQAETYKSCHSACWTLRSDWPRCQHSYHHRGPLNPIKIVQTLHLLLDYNS